MMQRFQKFLLMFATAVADISAYYTAHKDGFAANVDEMTNTTNGGNVQAKG